MSSTRLNATRGGGGSGWNDGGGDLAISPRDLNFFLSALNLGVGRPSSDSGAS